MIRPHGHLDSAGAYRNLIVSSSGGAPVYLRDIAEVRESLQDERMRCVLGPGLLGPAVTGGRAVYRRTGANAVRWPRASRPDPVITAELPLRGITPIYDRFADDRHSVHDVQVTLVIAFVLVVVVIFVFLGRAADTLIPAVALPLSLPSPSSRCGCWTTASTTCRSWPDPGHRFLVDDAIVFLENTVRRMERGERALEATAQQHP